MNEIQIHRPEPLIVLALGSNNAMGARVAEFVVPIPDPRLRTRISILQYVATPILVEGNSLQGKILLTTRERDRMGRANAFAFSLVNIAGTAAAGETFPASTDVNGGSWTFDGAGDEIYGKLSAFSEIEGKPVRFQLQVTYASMVRLCPDEWKQVVAKGVPYSLQVYDSLSGTTGT